MSPFTLGLIQMRMGKNKQENLQKACDMLEQAASQSVQIACLPELFTSEYFCQVEDQRLFDLAEPVPGETTQAIGKIAKKHKMTVLTSLFERRTAGVYHNTLVVIGPDGEIGGLYRKMHIPHDPLFYEKYYFTPGDTGFKAFDTPHARVGTLVCWDQWYPEAARLTAMQGAEVLFYPTAIGWHPSEKAGFGEAQVEAWQTMQRAHAISNGVFVASVNRVGHEVLQGDGIEFFGHSFIADPFGRILAQASRDKEEIITAKIDPALIEDTRRNWPFFRDRRIDAYGGLTSRWMSDVGCRMSKE